MNEQNFSAPDILTGIKKYMRRYVNRNCNPELKGDLLEGLYKTFVDPITTDEAYLELPVKDFHLPPRLYKILESLDITSIRDLAEADLIDLYRQPGFGKTAYQYVNHILERRNLLQNEP